MCNVLALLAVSGGFIVYFSYNPTIKVINETTITHVQEVTPVQVNPIPGVCLPIIVKFCQSPEIPYNYTVYPNFAGHFNQFETISVSILTEIPFEIYYLKHSLQELENHEALCDVKCYELVRLFVCSIYNPKCGTKGDGIPPCASLCNEAMHRCEFFIKVFGFTWPKYLECGLFKDSENAEECTGMAEFRKLTMEKMNASKYFYWY